MSKITATENQIIQLAINFHQHRLEAYRNPLLQWRADFHEIKLHDFIHSLSLQEINAFLAREVRS